MNNEKPIIFSTAMVRAILEGRKTQTRRVVTPVGNDDGFLIVEMRDGSWWPFRSHDGESLDDGNGCEVAIKCPYPVGTRLWVREAAWIWCEKRPDGQATEGRTKYRYVPIGEHVVYCADVWRSTECIDEDPGHRYDDPSHLWRCKTARFMPRWASRLTLEVTDVRVQRVQEITEEDAKAEGFESRIAFRLYWDSLNAARGHGWDENDWAWAYTFRRVA